MDNSINKTPAALSADDHEGRKRPHEPEKFGTFIKIPDDLLAKYWRETNWELAEETLAIYQKKLAMAATRRDFVAVRYWQRHISENIEVKKLAVRQTTKENPAAGIDGVRWVSDTDKMRGAIELRTKNYQAQPVVQISVYDRARNKNRIYGVPTIRDRAMQVLFSFSLSPVAESLGDRKSFAFRRGRSFLDAHYYILEALNRYNPPEWILIVDVKSFYDEISHKWLLHHIPMPKHILGEFLRKGILFQDEPSHFNQGISLGGNISPVLGNMVLDGLQNRLFALQKKGKEFKKDIDYSDGNLIRFADDVFVTARSEERAKRFKIEIEKFLGERGLRSSEEKTRIIHVDDGFNYLSRTYAKERGKVRCYPAKSSVDRFLTEIHSFIFDSPIPWSQGGLIKELNRKLHGWASYHRISDATRLYTYVDAAMNAMLLKLMQGYYPTKTTNFIVEKYWYTDNEGRKVFTLERDKSVRLLVLEDVILITQPRLYTKANPFIHTEYFDSRVQENGIFKISGRNKIIWERQGGKCYICKKAILPDQDRQLMHVDLRTKQTMRNMAYIHSNCADREFFMYHSDRHTVENVNIKEIAEVVTAKDEIRRHRRSVFSNLSAYFSEFPKKRVTLTFGQIEEIIGRKLCSAAYKHEEYWYRRSSDDITKCWQDHNFTIVNIDLAKQKLTFLRTAKPNSKIAVPERLQGGNLPEGAVHEIYSHFEYIIKKYGL